MHLGDIILIYNPKNGNRAIGKHSFVVVEDTNGTIRGLDFDFVGLIMSSMDTKEKHDKLMKYPANFPISPDEQDITNGGNGKAACIKVEQFYYFNKDKIKYRILGRLDEEIFDLLIEFIRELNQKGIQFQQIIDNL